MTKRKRKIRMFRLNAKRSILALRSVYKAYDTPASYDIKSLKKQLVLADQ